MRKPWIGLPLSARPSSVGDDARNLVARRGAFDAAGLAAAAGGDLRLDHHRAVRDVAQACTSPPAGTNTPRGNGNSVRRQQLLAVMLDQEHVRAA